MGDLLLVRSEGRGLDDAVLGFQGDSMEGSLDEARATPATAGTIAAARSALTDGDAVKDALAKAREFIGTARVLAAENPAVFEMLKDMTASQLNEIQSSNARSPVSGEIVPMPPAPSIEVVPGRGRKEASKTGLSMVKWNKTRKSLAVEYLILMCLILNSEGILTVDQVAAFVGQVFPIEGDGARASLIAKLARLKNEKNCLDRDEELKGFGYRISDGGRDYLRRLKDAYLTRDELVFLQERIGVTRV